ncbi:MAG: hypothetical protein E7185_08805 [Erysipelotrichaceae bacterium]|nr:hypothetical protein [Erysipelotrichaceae bacterium]
MKRILSFLCILLLCFGCSGKKVHMLTYDDPGMRLIKGPMEAVYGSKVVLHVSGIVDTGENYRLSVDGLVTHPTETNGREDIYVFMMPDRDVTIVIEPYAREYSESSTGEDSVSGQPEQEKREILADYYDQTVGTPEEQPYFEMVFYPEDSEHVRLEVYNNGGTENETMTAYLIPYQAYSEFIAAVGEYDMASWNSMEDGSGITGRMIVVKWADVGQFTRVTSEYMPDNGMEAFEAVRAVMAKYADDQYRIEE